MYQVQYYEGPVGLTSCFFLRISNIVLGGYVSELLMRAAVVVGVCFVCGMEVLVLMECTSICSFVFGIWFSHCNTIGTVLVE